MGEGTRAEHQTNAGARELGLGNLLGKALGYQGSKVNVTPGKLRQRAPSSVADKLGIMSARSGRAARGGGAGYTAPKKGGAFVGRSKAKYVKTDSQGKGTTVLSFNKKRNKR